MPLFGSTLAKMLFILLDATDLDVVRTESNKWCAVMLGFAVLSFFTGFLQKFTFGVIGENVTQRIRMRLYRHIMVKDLGWFDERDNAPSVLTSTLSSDA